MEIIYNNRYKNQNYIKKKIEIILIDYNKILI